MARKKKEPEAVYVEAGYFDNLVKISMKNSVSIEQLRELNPDIRNCMYLIPKGKKVRIA
jgi:hypothetical protein